ncbi:hypothetical protein BDQ17DRAFT_1344896 [Cyathus striatus]|nr:hypothetical protein BDQ17DRAFT_1344896 [Cyathus striatus]
MERTPSPANDIDYTVHNYTHPISSRTSTTELLEEGHNLIVSAGSKSKGWVSVKLTETVQPPKRNSRIYLYASPCPHIVQKDILKVANSELKEWDSPVDDSEKFRLEDLEEFISTGLKPVFDRPRSSSFERPRKRRKLDHGPLHGILPQPHIHPSNSMKLRRFTKIHPYRKTKPMAIPPYTIPLPLPSEYDRCAWIIPVRGILPWEHCSSASVLDPSQQIPLRLDADENQMYWTHKALDAFWEFLLKLKDVGSVGSLGVSFHASSSYQSSMSSINPPFIHSISQNHSTSKSEPSERSASVPRITLSSVDYIKVYQETRNAMYVRTALDAWAYNVHADDNGSLRTEGPTKVRVLKGARLALVDARSKGMLVS